MATISVAMAQDMDSKSMRARPAALRAAADDAEVLADVAVLAVVVVSVVDEAVFVALGPLLLSPLLLLPALGLLVPALALVLLALALAELDGPLELVAIAELITLPKELLSATKSDRNSRLAEGDRSVAVAANWLTMSPATEPNETMPVSLASTVGLKVARAAGSVMNLWVTAKVINLSCSFDLNAEKPETVLHLLDNELNTGSWAFTEAARARATRSDRYSISIVTATGGRWSGGR